MRQEYTPNKPKRKHLCHELRLHLARLWNRRIERNDATLTLRSFAEQEGLENGFRVVSNCGPDACQSVPHLHFHILGGRQMGDQMA